jgi:hypothetical protein
MKASRGREHLRATGAAPRAAGSEGEARVRDYCAFILRNAGYEVAEEPFTYSAFPGRLGTPIAGIASGGGLWFSMALAADGSAIGALLFAVATLTIVGSYGLLIARLGTTSLPWMRRRSANLTATPPGDAPRLWLVAHVDSKSQPVPILVRSAGIIVHGGVWIAAALLLIAAITGVASSGTGVWRSLAVVGVLSAVPIAASTVGDRSAGAADNASGVAAVLVAAEKLAAGPGVGIVMTSAEELGLAGARAWLAAREPGTVLNCDTIDDGGDFIAVHGWGGPGRAARLLAGAASEGSSPRLMRLIPGILVDAVAFAEAGWDAATLSRGTMGTLARIHTAGDDLGRLTGESIDAAAELLVAAAREGAEWS